MTVYDFGDIVLIGFPHTGLDMISKRPAMAIYDSGDRDILVAKVTTQPYASTADYRITSWKESGLLAESYLRLGKQATIEKKYIVRRLGTLNSSEVEAVRKIIRKMFSL